VEALKHQHFHQQEWSYPMVFRRCAHGFDTLVSVIVFKWHPQKFRSKL
jgi:hypothetical protein